MKHPKFEIKPRKEEDIKKAETLSKLMDFEFKHYNSKFIKIYRKWFKKAIKNPYYGMVKIEWKD